MNRQMPWLCLASAMALGHAASAEPPRDADKNSAVCGDEPAKGKPAATPPTAAAPERSARGRANAKALDEFYRADEVQSLHLEVAAADRNRMLAALPDLIDVPASFRWRDVTVENVSVRFKGNSSANPKRPGCATLSGLVAGGDGVPGVRRSGDPGLWCETPSG